MEASPDLGQRALVALAELRVVLGPNALETESASDDPSALEQHVDDGLAALRRMLPGYTAARKGRFVGALLRLLAGRNLRRRLGRF
jgi:hypothetical protein